MIWLIKIISKFLKLLFPTEKKEIYDPYIIESISTPIITPDSFIKKFPEINPPLSSALNRYLTDKKYIEHYLHLIKSSAKTYNIPWPILVGIMSRESGGGRFLTPPGPEGTNKDKSDYGLMQISKKWHSDFINSGAWKIPSQIINKAAQILKTNVNYVISHNPELNEAEKMMIAISGYNVGIGRAFSDYVNYNDSDKRTSKSNYAKDVLTIANSIS